MKTCLDLHLYFRYLDENLELELMLEWVKTLGASGIRWMYFAGKKNINLGGGRGWNAMNLIGSPKWISWNPNPQYETTWR